MYAVHVGSEVTDWKVKGFLRSLLLTLIVLNHEKFWIVITLTSAELGWYLGNQICQKTSEICGCMICTDKLLKFRIFISIKLWMSSLLTVCHIINSSSLPGIGNKAYFDFKYRIISTFFKVFLSLRLLWFFLLHNFFWYSIIRHRKSKVKLSLQRVV
jgi:hypothetical protein